MLPVVTLIFCHLGFNLPSRWRPSPSPYAVAFMLETYPVLSDVMCVPCLPHVCLVTSCSIIFRELPPQLYVHLRPGGF